jgi:hypothetical protein
MKQIRWLKLAAERETAVAALAGARNYQPQEKCRCAQNPEDPEDHASKYEKIPRRLAAATCVFSITVKSDRHHVQPL